MPKAVQCREIKMLREKEHKKEHKVTILECDFTYDKKYKAEDKIRELLKANMDFNYSSSGDVEDE